MDLGLKNKRVIINGGSKGIGSSVADFLKKRLLLTLASETKIY